MQCPLKILLYIMLINWNAEKDWENDEGSRGGFAPGGGIELVGGVILGRWDRPGGRPGARHAPADIALGADIGCRPVSHIIPRGLQ